METKWNGIIPKKNFYVVMTDSFMSGWGMAEGATNKLVIGCDDYERANYLVMAAKRRPEMKYVNLTSRKPRFRRKRVFVSYVDENVVKWGID